MSFYLFLRPRSLGSRWSKPGAHKAECLRGSGPPHDNHRARTPCNPSGPTTPGSPPEAELQPRGGDQDQPPSVHEPSWARLLATRDASRPQQRRSKATGTSAKSRRRRQMPTCAPRSRVTSARDHRRGEPASVGTSEYRRGPRGKSTTTRRVRKHRLGR